MRTGLIAQKLGMTRVFTDGGKHIPVTVLKVDDCRVVSKSTEEKNGYNSLLLGVGKAKPKNLSKSQRGHFAKNSVEPKFKVAEFRISSDAFVNVGANISVDHFVPGQKVDVTGSSIGKGFAGAMKRHNFAGLRASHGVSISHRAHGSTGQCQDPGKVFKGKKMAGHMGDEKVTVQNLEIVSSDKELGIIMIKGGIPGSAGGFVIVKDSIKKAMPENIPFPASLNSDADEKTQKTTKNKESKKASKTESVKLSSEDKPKVEKPESSNKDLSSKEDSNE